ncbi:hypothetical protein ABZ783_35980 [Micromonospora sp. NPDC047738]|uniref:hypothetical protein n=1 Tax=Micromonospora sp. NPDC047738 TaxID=3155741 RepID=UPI0033E3E782
MANDESVDEGVPPGGLREWVMRTGVTTRTITLRSGERYSFAREALDDTVRQVESRFIPMAVEHLSYLPPLGRIYRAEVVEDDTGHADLIFRARELHRRRSRDLTLREIPVDGEPNQPDIDLQLSAEPRNFEPADWEELTETAPIQLRHTAAWSELPPLIWILSSIVTWGVGEFAKAFVARFGENFADRLPSWLVAAGKKAKDSDRHNLLEFRFETSLGILVTAYIPFDPQAADAVEKLRDGLDGLGAVGDFAGYVNQGGGEDLQLAAFIFDSGEFRLAWWASPDTAYVSPWFERHYPDPTLFLGRPVLAPKEEDDQEVRELPVPEQPRAARRQPHGS